MATHVGPHVDAGVHGGHHGAPPRPVRLPVRVLRVVLWGEPTGGLAGADGREHVAVATRYTRLPLFPWSVFQSLTSHSLLSTMIIFLLPCDAEKDEDEEEGRRESRTRSGGTGMPPGTGTAVDVRRPSRA